MTTQEALDVVAVLTDSRGFDTYYLNDRYEAWYGADKIFASLLGRRLLSDRDPPLHAVHIPDHFRSGTVENNLLRLGLCDPVFVVLCDGIWETLINREHLVDYATRAIRAGSFSDTTPLNLEISHKAAADLYLADALSISPKRYAERIGLLVSYFARRRRKVCWLSLLVPSTTHKNRVHHAGDYKASPEWHRCLDAVNQNIREVLAIWGGAYVDLQALMNESGGEEACILDQWHFTESFHAHVSDLLFDLILRDLDTTPVVPGGHVSRRFMVPGKLGAVPLAVVGDGGEAWCHAAPSDIQAQPVTLEAAAGLEDGVVLVAEQGEKRDEIARRLLSVCPASTIVVYPDEIDGIKNPPPGGARGGER